MIIRMGPQRSARHRELGKERFLLLAAILLSLIFLIESPQNVNNITGAQTAIESFTNTNYFLGAVLILLSLLFAMYIAILLRRRKPRPWHQELLYEDDIPLATWEARPELPLNDKISQLNKELWNLSKETSPPSKKILQKTTTIPNIKEKRLTEELERIEKDIQGYAAPLVLKAPKRQKQLEQDFQAIKERLENLEDMSIKKVKMREELPSRLSLSSMAEKRTAFDDESGALQQKVGSKNRREAKKEAINKDLAALNQKIAEVENMEIQKVNILEHLPQERHFTDLPQKKQLQHELSEVDAYLTDSLEFSALARKKKTKHSKAQKSRSPKEQQAELQEIEKRILRLEE